MHTNTESSVRALADLNIELLEQAADVLMSIDDDLYTRPAEIFGGQRIGGHVRHIVEFYEGLFEGVHTGLVDYAARRRDPQVETIRTAALERIAVLCVRLGADGQLFEYSELSVRPEHAMPGCLRSTPGRELDAVASHTVHHFAMIAVLLRYFGFPVHEDFGVSKATLRYRVATSAQAA